MEEGTGDVPVDVLQDLAAAPGSGIIARRGACDRGSASSPIQTAAACAHHNPRIRSSCVS